MYDAIVVGARVAGSPTAMLLARRGYRVLLLDRDSFPSDIMSTHYIHLPGQARLHQWGLLDKVVASGAPMITARSLHFDGVTISPPDIPMPAGMSQDTICPRRYVLDKVLVDAAVEAGAELREGVSVRELIWEDGRVAGVRGHHGNELIEERARIVIGADGLHSMVAREVKPEEYDVHPSLTYGYYTYWTGVQDTGMHIYFFSEGNGILVFPTNDGKHCIGVGGVHEEFKDFRADIEGNYMRALEKVPALLEQVKAGERERFLGTADMPNYFRKPYGPGWALTGDAGYHRDFITGLGINDAFLQAELLAAALHEAWSGKRSEEEALADFQKKRDDYVKPTYDVTIKIAAGEQVDPMAFMQFGLALMRQVPQPESAHAEA
ncbi:MAG TPA: NAD(P)/FAD-dependent oxidoreductase [Dehalococcoidia bacterium]|nr:NAD(P)/FAD-dependent oxidoreductase [Dehalococcoidia bacterium]